MKICVGLKDSIRMEEYIKAGAEEFYCGVVDSEWTNRFGYVTGINRRPWPSSNMSSFEELKRVVQKAHSFNCKVYFTINEHCYTNEQLKLIDHYVKKALETGIDSIIFSDPGLIKYFYDKYQCCVHLSTGGSVFNQWSAEFFLDKLKVSRIIMPREVTLNEIRKICREVENVEYEVFVLNEGCINIDGFCNHLHGIHYIDNKGQIKNGDYSVGCMLKYDLLEGQINGKSIDKSSNIIEQLYDASSNCGSCGACAIYYFKKFGISSLKLVGRSTDKDKIIHDIKFIKYAKELSNEVANFQEYSQKIREYKGDRTMEKCIKMCYYPEILAQLELERSGV